MAKVTTRPLRWGIAASLVLLMGCAPAADSRVGDHFGRFSLAESAFTQWKLPEALWEISGLAITEDGRLLAVCDEEAIVYELDYQQGRIVSTFSLGSPPVPGDFEGIAVSMGRLYLVTSDGEIYSSGIGIGGDKLEFEVFETGLGKRCEIEGLTRSETGDLLLACKERRGRGVGALSVFTWSRTSKALLENREIVIPEQEILRQLGVREISPSGIAVDPITRHLIIVASRQRAVIEMTRSGDLVSAMEFPLASRHRQAEGIEITRNGKLLIADEGGKKKKPRLTLYSLAGSQD